MNKKDLRNYIREANLTRNNKTEQCKKNKVISSASYKIKLIYYINKIINIIKRGRSI